ncbi:pyridoxal phosphate-dependent decarboxylase family protein [Pseudolysinimonas sp.]|uniref:pyridoxal phosphate-dependent decarboxylase family protein n=1 Tax=Pseudolysinimonas sp. TaxID=2680009 RepID=UPI003F7E3B80
MSAGPFRAEPDAILARLAELRALDAPTHGGRVLSYVYDPGDAALDELAAAAIRAMQPVNGLDPTTFPSVAALERDLVGFARGLLHGDDEVVGSVTTGGTESCLLAVKTARDVWRAARPDAGAPRLVAPTTAHAAFQKAAHYLGLELDLVPVDADGRVDPEEIVDRLDDDVALVVVSAPSYPVAALDPVEPVAAACAARGIALHVDACIGGLVLPFWPGLPAWDFAVPGVMSVSADLHKYGYAPKGVSVLLQRGRDRQRAQYFATTRWPGYPVVNPTVLGSKSAGPLAAAWAIVQALGAEGFAALADDCRRATAAVRETVAGIEGLRIVGEPAGPLLAVAADETVPADRRVDPHHWADAVRASGWVLQLQPGLAQEGGVRLPPTTHLTITPVTERGLPELLPVLAAGADAVRGVPSVDAAQVLAALPPLGSAPLDSETAAGILAALGLGGGSGALPDRQAPLLALIEAVPAPVAERLLVELLGRLVEPATRVE